MFACFNYKKMKKKNIKKIKLSKNKFRLSILLYSVYLRNKFIKSYIK